MCTGALWMIEMANEPTLCLVLVSLSYFFSSLCFQELPGGATAHCLDPVYLGLISDPTLLSLHPCPWKALLWQEAGISSHSSRADLGKHLIMNLRSDLPSLNKWALSSNEEGSKERAVETLSNVTGAAADLPGWGQDTRMKPMVACLSFLVTKL